METIRGDKLGPPRRASKIWFWKHRDPAGPLNGRLATKRPLKSLPWYSKETVAGRLEAKHPLRTPLGRRCSSRTKSLTDVPI